MSPDAAARRDGASATLGSSEGIVMLFEAPDSTAT